MKSLDGVDLQVDMAKLIDIVDSSRTFDETKSMCRIEPGINLQVWNKVDRRIRSWYLDSVSACRSRTDAASI